MQYSNGIIGVLIGRFTSVEDFSLVGTRFSVTWNNGLLTPGASGQYTVGQVVSPSPGAVGLMGAAGLIVGRRRRRSESRDAVGPA
jgi:MYXO-CTERM domain-containing protein